MKVQNILVSSFFALSLIFLSSCSSNKGIDTKKDSKIKKMVNRYADYVEKKGVKKLISKMKRLYKSGKVSDEYLFMFNKKKRLVIHPNKNILNKKILDIREEKKNGRYIVKEMFSLAKKHPQGFWFEYTWRKNNGSLGIKRSYLKPLKNGLIGSGYFKKKK